MTQLETIQIIDTNLRGGIELIWNRRSKLQGYNLALVENELEESDYQEIADLSFRIDMSNQLELSNRSELIPKLRLNRLDFMKTQESGVVLIEQNPGWVDNIGMAAILTEDFTILERIKTIVEDSYANRIQLLYCESTKAGRYEQELTAQLFTSLGIESISSSILESEVTCDDGVILSAPESKLSAEESQKIERIRNLANFVSPSYGEIQLEDNSLLNNYGVGLSSVLINNIVDFKSKVKSGLSIAKSTTSESGGGIAFLTGEENEMELQKIMADLADDAGNILLQERVEPTRVLSGIGLDFIGEPGNRPKGSPIKPLEIDLSGRAIKYTAWTVNGIVCSIIGTVARDNSIYVNDAGFNFNAGKISQI